MRNPIPVLCSCGCGQMTKGQHSGPLPFAKGHQNRGKSATHRKKPAGFPEDLLIDDEDRERLGVYRWSYSGNGYAQRHHVVSPGKYTKIRLHQEILGFPSGVKIDHINGNRKDNRKENLRLLDDTGNSQNQALSSANTSGYRGVSWMRGKWYASAKVAGKMISLGFYDDLHEAGRVAAEYRRQHYKAYVDR